jgi:5-methylcytosine-specific restriction endonuclease McrA
MNVAAADLAAAASAPPSERGRVLPIAAGRYELRATIDQTTYDKLLKLQALLSHAVPSGDLAEVLGRAFGAAIREFEKRRFGKRGTTADDSNVRPARRRMSKSARQIPAGVRRAVHERDSGRCTFVSATGRRCEETRFLQFDHVHPVARGGTSTVDNLRLRCRAHNQYEAQRMFGAGFMAEKRASAGTPRSARTAVSAASAGTGAGAASAGSARDAAQTHERATPRPANAPLPPEQEELVPWLRALGFTVKEARSGATACASNPSASLEDRMKLALRSLAPRSARRVLPVASAGA